LAWARLGKDWRICHASETAYDGIEDRDDEWEWKPIIDCPVYLRVQMIDEFEKLRLKVLEEAENEIPQLEQAIARFRSILKS
jgi:hypothetical protein